MYKHTHTHMHIYMFFFYSFLEFSIPFILSLNFSLNLYFGKASTFLSLVKSCILPLFLWSGFFVFFFCLFISLRLCGPMNVVGCTAVFHHTTPCVFLPLVTSVYIVEHFAIYLALWYILTLSTTSFTILLNSHSALGGLKCCILPPLGPADLQIPESDLGAWKKRKEFYWCWVSSASCCFAYQMFSLLDLYSLPQMPFPSY